MELPRVPRTVKGIYLSFRVALLCGFESRHALQCSLSSARGQGLGHKSISLLSTSRPQTQLCKSC